jgi:hypothetical protein
MAGTGFKLAGSSPRPLGDRWRRRSLTLPNLSTRGAVIHRSPFAASRSVSGRGFNHGRNRAGEQVTGVPVPSHGDTPFQPRPRIGDILYGTPCQHTGKGTKTLTGTFYEIVPKP